MLMYIFQRGVVYTIILQGIAYYMNSHSQRYSVIYNVRIMNTK